MDEEVCNVVGPKGKHDGEGAAVRHGHESGEVTMGGRRVQPRVTRADGEHEVRLGVSEHFGWRDPLTRLVLEQVLASVSTRRIAHPGAGRGRGRGAGAGDVEVDGEP
jgi:hypothetical protein